MTVNSKFLNKLSKSLFSANPEVKLNFEDCLIEGNSGRQAVILLKPGTSDQKPELKAEKSFFDFVIIPESRTEPDEIRSICSGPVYFLDNSSVFAASVLQAIESKITVILDACASPGGKSIIAWKYLSPEFLLSNEVISKRIPMLISNLKDCSISPSAVTCFDTKVLANKYPNTFDLVIADTPCSGQSLMAKGEKAPGALNPSVIKLNSGRQKRILANCVSLTAPGGYLAYMTCTYSIEENEKVASWLLGKFPFLQALEAVVLEKYRSQYCDFPAYRLFPDAGIGAGGFAVIFRNMMDGEKRIVDFYKEKYIWKNGI